MEGRLPSGSATADYIQGLIASPQKVATRKASELALEAINAVIPETIGVRPISPVPTIPRQRLRSL
jgi:transketolase